MKYLFKCDICGKIFENEDLCKNHEIECTPLHPIECIYLKYNDIEKKYNIEIVEYLNAIEKNGCYKLYSSAYFYSDIKLNKIYFNYDEEKETNENLYVYIDDFTKENEYIKKLFEYRKNQLLKRKKAIDIEENYLNQLISDYNIIIKK